MSEPVLEWCPICQCKLWHTDGVCEWLDSHPMVGGGFGDAVLMNDGRFWRGDNTLLMNETVVAYFEIPRITPDTPMPGGLTENGRKIWEMLRDFNDPPPSVYPLPCNYSTRERLTYAEWERTHGRT